MPVRPVFDVRRCSQSFRLKIVFGTLSKSTRSRLLYTAPTAIRAFVKWGDEHIDKHDLGSLRLLGTVGEGINPETWIWYHEKIGNEKCPIVDTWWQTETGGIMMSPLPGAIATKPGSCTKPLPGIIPAIVDEEGKPVDPGNGGWLVITHPWPGMLRGIYGDDERYKDVYWNKVRATISPATTLAATVTDTTGLWDASTTC